MLELSSIINSLREDTSLPSLEEALKKLQQLSTESADSRYTKLEAEICFLVAKADVGKYRWMGGESIGLSKRLRRILVLFSFKELLSPRKDLPGLLRIVQV